MKLLKCFMKFLKNNIMFGKHKQREEEIL